MEAKASPYIPQAFRAFQGFSVVDIKESVSQREMEVRTDKRRKQSSFMLEVRWKIRRSRWAILGNGEAHTNL